MHDDLGDHAEQEELDDMDGEAEASPVVAVLHDLEGVPVEVDVSIKVHLVERLHGDLVLAMVLGLVGRLLEGQVVLDGAAGVAGLLVLTRADRGDDDPVAAQDWDRREDGKEEGELEAAANLPRQVQGNNGQDREDEEVGEALGAGGVGGEWRIFD